MTRNMDSLKQYIDLFLSHRAEIESHAPHALNNPRERALKLLESQSLPKKGDEGYPVVSVSDMFAPDYGVNINRIGFRAEPSEAFRCGVPNVSTLVSIVANDSFQPTQGLLRNLPEGVQVMSLARAAEEMPELVERYYDKLAGAEKMIPTAPHSDATAVMPPSAVSLLNTLLAQDGVFVHIGAGVKLDKAIQIVNIFNASQPLMGVRRLLIVLEEGAEASILICDHTVDQKQKYLSCQVTETFLGEGARLECYDLEESSASTSRHAQFYAKQREGSSLTVNGTTLIGGITRNSYYVEHSGRRVETRLAGMAIADGEQIVDNATCIIHNHPDGVSDQMFKYILNDDSRGSFYGTIIVDEKARFTKAYQTNRNILASASAKMHTRPQLEIYCDEVKCSHGATVGQLDANALFYMRQRGIPEHQAKMMLMQAFMADVIDTVGIPSLRSRLAQLIELRLAGTRELCAGCEGQCEQ